jgi:Family of unknown function (DUF6065)
MKLTAYVLEGHELDIRPAPVERGWMDATVDRFAYRCLPLAPDFCAGSSGCCALYVGMNVPHLVADRFAVLNISPRQGDCGQSTVEPAVMPLSQILMQMHARAGLHPGWAKSLR